MDYSKLVAEHRAWVEANYPKQPPWMPALGMMEEAGELLSSFLKFHQREAFGNDSRGDKDWYAEMLDAVGDCALYCLSWCSAAGANGCEILLAEEVEGDVPVQTMLSHLMSAAECIRATGWKEYAYLYVSILRGVAKKLSVDFEEAVYGTWQTVQSRKREPQAPAEAVR